LRIILRSDNYFVENKTNYFQSHVFQLSLSFPIPLWFRKKHRRLMKWWRRNKNSRDQSHGINRYFIYLIGAIVAIPISVFFIYLTISMMAFGPNTPQYVSIISPELFLVMRWGLVFITFLIFFIFLPMAIYKVFKAKRLI